MRILEDHRDRDSLGLRSRCARLGACDVAGPHRAALGPVEARHEAQQRGLAAARGPEQRDEVAGRDREVDAGERRHLAAGFGAEGAVDAFERDRDAAVHPPPPGEGAEASRRGRSRELASADARSDRRAASHSRPSPRRFALGCATNDHGRDDYYDDRYYRNDPYYGGQYPYAVRARRRRPREPLERHQEQEQRALDQEQQAEDKDLRTEQRDERQELKQADQWDKDRPPATARGEARARARAAGRAAELNQHQKQERKDYRKKDWD